MPMKERPGKQKLMELTLPPEKESEYRSPRSPRTPGALSLVSPRGESIPEMPPTPKPGKMKKAMLVDSTAMKEKLKQNMHKPKYNVADFYYTTGRFQALARNHTFENVTLAVIAFNALWMSIDTDANSASVLTEAHPIFIIAENLFCVYFTMEIVVRFGAFQNKLNCCRDAWFCFDFVLVTMMIVETWIMVAFILISGAGSSGLGNAGLLRLMRLMRLSRMARMARLLRAMPELLILIKGMVAATRAVGVTLFLLIIILYIFGILFRQLAEGLPTGEKFFPSVLASMHSLVIFGIQFDGVINLVDSIEEDSAYQLIPPFYLFVLIATLTVLNMLIGVLCEVISAVAMCEHEEIQIHHLRDELQQIVDRQCDYEPDGKTLKIGKANFLKILQDEGIANLLNEVKVEPLGMVDLIDTLFTNENADELVFRFSDIIEIIMDQRSSNIATVKDATDLRKFMKGRLDKLEQGVEAKMRAMGRLAERGLGLPRGTWQKEIEKAAKARDAGHCDNPDGASPINQELGDQVEEIVLEARFEDDQNLCKPWETRSCQALSSDMKNSEVVSLHRHPSDLSTSYNASCPVSVHEEL